MADIDIQRKGPSIVPWIIGLIILVALTWALMAMFDGDDAVDEPVSTSPATDVMEPVSGQPGSAAMPAAVQQFLTSCAPVDPAAMGLDHQYTSNCIQQLVDGVDALLQDRNLSSVDVQAQMQSARQRAEQLVQSAPQSSQHAGMTREAFLSITSLLNAVQDARFPNLEGQVTQLEETARGVQESSALLDQREPVQRFFRQAGDILNAMMAPATGA